ncbi:protein-L-isoaspartate(D-aspartate) O-methyltransferase [Candidatus Woesearchaeota archaeon]|nr:protein-L-isoaspartate(D-aspartate) O-methyltransferase [Candidatus Woesearchaeota archaeon]MBW3016419.1 protein-L-isoaspartate(D-aspartate) O-methyltransferase [Candidatus Woesearchaeota archaeon]
MKAELIKEYEKLNIDKRVIKVFKEVKREKFVLPQYKKQAYLDVALPIIAGQTISQPSTVILMLDALEVGKDMKVLEIGAGSGYNAALLGKLAKKVYSIERIKELAEMAKKNLKGIKNVEIIWADGKKGYEKEAPYDRIIVTAAAKTIPKKLLEQLKDNGTLLMPVGPEHSQELIRARKKGKKFHYEKLGGYVFVPLV